MDEEDADAQNEPEVIDLSDDDEKDVDLYYSIAKEYELSCNISIAKRNALSSKLEAHKNRRATRHDPRQVEDERTLLRQATIPVLEQGFVKTAVYGQVINKLVNIHPTPDRNSQLDCVVYKDIMESLNILAGLSTQITELDEKYSKVADEKREIDRKYRDVSVAMQEKLSGDASALHNGIRQDIFSLDDFAKKYDKKCMRLQILYMLVKMIVSKSGANFVENPGLVKVLKKFNQPFSLEKALNQIRSGEGHSDDEERET
ncbi:uncharacterized protein LOC132203151 [Neocloeon triangulifer]|uniref:uncharacterized protein LOC132203151 n=1 Tax=Neocloeon triangulifer TaxID=2078957 RepID=UPI00286F2246|nr:uncharacterized protein LOC132203151 [Neocloeon triangulifer]